MNITHIVSQPIGWASQGLGTLLGHSSYQPFNTTGQKLSNIGKSITDPNQVLTNPWSLVAPNLTSTKSFSDVQHNSTSPNSTINIAYAQPINTNDSSSYDGSSYGSYGSYGSSGSVGAGGGVGGYAYDPQVLGQYDQAIGTVQSGIDRLGGQLDVGNKNIDTSYNDSKAQLDLAKGRNQSAYDNQKIQGQQDYVQTKNSIGAKAGNQVNSLQRLLGARGAGGSSAFLFNAPQTVAHDASLQRSQAGQTFGRNMASLDTNFNNYLNDYNGSVADLGTQRENSRNALQAKIDSTRAGLLQNLGTLISQKTAYQGGNGTSAFQPYLDQANGLMTQADQLGIEKPSFSPRAANYTAPTFDAYTVNPNAAPVVGSQNALADNISPYLQLLLGKDKNQRQQFGF